MYILTIIPRGRAGYKMIYNQRGAYCTLRNETKRNEMKRNEMKICSLRHKNL